MANWWDDIFNQAETAVQDVGKWWENIWDQPKENQPFDPFALLGDQGNDNQAPDPFQSDSARYIETAGNPAEGNFLATQAKQQNEAAANAEYQAQAQLEAQQQQQMQQQAQSEIPQQQDQEPPGSFIEAHYTDNARGDQPDWWSGQTDNYDMPQNPYKNQNQNFGSVLDIYRAFGIPTGQTLGIHTGSPGDSFEINGEQRSNLAGMFESARTLPADYFNSNVPLSLWLPDGQLIKAETPEEFKELVLFAQENSRYLPGTGTEPQWQNGVQKIDFAEFKDWVEQQKAADTPEQQELDSLLVQRHYRNNYDADVAAFEARGYTVQGNKIYNQDGDEVTAKDLIGIDAAYADRLKKRYNRWGAGKGDNSELDAQIEQAQDAVDTQESKRLPDQWTYKTEDNQSVIINPVGWKRYQDGKYVSPDGQVLTSQEIIDNPEHMKDFENSISDRDAKRLATWMDDNPKQAIKLLGKAADTPELRAILQKILPGTTPDESKMIIAALPKTNGQLLTEVNLIKELVNSPRTPENDKRLASLLTSPNGNTIDPATLNMFSRDWITGSGQMNVGVGGALKRIGLNDLGNDFINRGLKYMAVAPPAVGNAFVDTLNELNQQVPFMLSMVGLSMIGGGIGGEIGAAMGGTRLMTVLETVGGRFGMTAFGSKILQSLGAGALETPFMASIMAGQTFEDAKQKGWSDQEAFGAFDKVAAGMATVSGLLNTVTFGAGAMGASQNILARLLAKGMDPKLATLVVNEGKVGISTLTGAGNMMYINVLQKYALNEPLDTPELIKAAILGGILGFVTSGTAKWSTMIDDKVMEKAYKLNPERWGKLKEKYDAWKGKYEAEQTEASARSAEASKTLSPDQSVIDYVLENDADLRAKLDSASQEKTFNEFLTWAKEQRANEAKAKVEDQASADTHVKEFVDWAKEQKQKELKTLEEIFGNPDWPKKKAAGKPADVQQAFNDIANSPEGKTAIPEAVKETKNEMLADELKKAKARQAELDAKEKGVKEPTKAKPAETTKAEAPKPPAITVEDLRKQFPNASEDELKAIKAAREAKQARGGTVPQPEAKPLNELDQKIKDAQDRLGAAYKKANEKGAINDADSKEFYSSLVDLASLYIQKGAKTVQEFAEMAGLEVNAALKHAWKAAQNAPKSISDYEKLPKSVQAEVPRTQVYVKRDFNPKEQEAVDSVKELSGEITKAYNAASAANQKRLANVGAKLEAAQENASGLEALKQSAQALKGKLQEIGINPDKMKISDEHLDTLINIARTSTNVDVFEKYVAEKALQRLKEQYRPPRPYELKIINKIFGQDTVGLFKIEEKAQLGDYLTEIFYNSLLTVKSNIPNTVGNTIGVLFSPLERGVAAAVDIPLSKLQGRARARYFGEVAQDIYGAWSGIPEGARAWLDVLKTGRSEMAMKGEVKGEAFKGKLGAVINFNSRLMSATDQLFRSINEQAALRSEAYRMAANEKLSGEQLKSRVNELVSAPPEELYLKSKKIATYRLYQDSNQVSEALIKVRDIAMVGGIQPLRLLIPFVRTPVDLVKFGLERSPVAALNPSLWIDAIKKRPEAADKIARWVIGSTISTALFIYAKDGLITGAPPTTPAERDAFYRSGKQPYSLKIGDKWVSYQRLEPFNQMLVQVADVVDAIENKKAKGDIGKIAGQVVLSIGQNILSQNYITGLSDAVNALADPDRYGEQWIQNQLTSIIPGSGTLRIAAQTLDNTIRSPQNIPQAVETIIPGMSQNVPPKINVFGEPQKRETPAWEPYTFTTAKNDKVNTALANAGVEPGFSGRSITFNKRQYKLDDNEVQEYRTLTGQIMHEQLTKAVNRGVTKTELLQNIVDEARTKARDQYLALLIKRKRKPDEVKK